MRLIQLKIKNIASLKGDHEVNFEDIVKESPLFAITGDTGAGKSTLLNCIALSLYGEIYKRGVNQTDVVTLGEKEGAIELLFQAQGKYYLAEWQGRIRKQNGELLKTPLTDRNIFQINAPDIKATRLQRIESAEKLLNLDFDQFCKCIILNQGEFARFLSSSFTERKDILEKLYPNGKLLESIGVQLKREIEIKERQLSEIDIECKTLIGSGPDLKELKDQQNNSSIELKIKKEWLDFLKDAHYHFTSIKSYHLKHQENSSKSSIAINEIATMTTTLNNLMTVATQAEENLKRAQERQQRELPVLQEMIKKEQEINTYNQQINALEVRRVNTDQLINSSNIILKSLQGELKDWNLKINEINSGFHFDKNKIHTFHHEIDSFLEIMNKNEFSQKELTSLQTKLQDLEVDGLSKTSQINELTKMLLNAPKDIQFAIEDLNKLKTQIQNKKELKQKAAFQLQECQLQVQKAQKEVEQLKKNLDESLKSRNQCEQELIPIQSTLRLQSLLSAVEVCLNHPELTDKCPVCETHLSHQRLAELRSNVQKAEIGPLKSKEDYFLKEIIKLDQLISHLTNQLKDFHERIIFEQDKEKGLLFASQVELEEITPIDQKLSDYQKILWEHEKTTKDVDRLNSERDKIRAVYVQTKKEITSIEEELNKTVSVIQEFIHKFGDNTILENIHLFREDAKKIKILLQLNMQGERIQQDIKHQQNLLNHHLNDQEKINLDMKDTQAKIQALTSIVQAQLGSKTASALIVELQESTRLYQIDFNKKQDDLKKQELLLKESNGRLYSLKDLLKEIELLFEQEKTILKSLILPKSYQEDEELKTLLKSIPKLGLTLQSPQELFLPLAELIKNKTELIQNHHQELQLSLAQIEARLNDWEKRKDRLALLELKKDELLQVLQKKRKLFEILGKDEMRTYVLSVVEENLIIQTNDELQKLCQGRYEIVHQQKKQRLPEFYILDKFREAGLRKVSTLSGGETFMVSLAMALGLAELTRGSAEIDSLFIDEGFGTLDQNSLEDVLDMLKQIQTRGLMVGLISHVRSLTQALPLNLLLTKKTDGTSHISLQYN
jgi:exonuclease SbcC